MLAEGKNPAREALAADETIEKVLVLDHSTDPTIRQLVNEARQRKIGVEFVQKEALDRLSKTGHHQGIIVVTTEFKYTPLEDVLNLEGRRFFVILDKLSDPHNLGSIIRSAECAGVSAVIIPARNSVPVNETVIRTSAGAISHVKVCKVGNLNDAIKKIKEAGVFVYATDMDGKDMHSVNLKGDVAIIIGSEGFGVSPLSKKLADETISIKMKGKLNSLNASVAAGIVMFEVLRQGE